MYHINSYYLFLCNITMHGFSKVCFNFMFYISDEMVCVWVCVHCCSLRVSVSIFMSTVMGLKVKEVEVETVRCEDLALCLINYDACHDNHKKPGINVWWPTSSSPTITYFSFLSSTSRFWNYQLYTSLVVESLSTVSKSPRFLQIVKGQAGRRDSEECSLNGNYLSHIQFYAILSPLLFNYAMYKGV